MTKKNIRREANRITHVNPTSQLLVPLRGSPPLIIQKFHLPSIIFLSHPLAHTKRKTFSGFFSCKFQCKLLKFTLEKTLKRIFRIFLYARG
jgi:hypothetical protein